MLTVASLKKVKSGIAPSSLSNLLDYFSRLSAAALSLGPADTSVTALFSSLFPMSKLMLRPNLENVLAMSSWAVETKPSTPELVAWVALTSNG